MKDVFWDLETHRFGPQNLAPPPVVMSVTTEEGSFLVAKCEPEWRDAVELVLTSHAIGTRTCYDWAVLLNAHPELAERIFKSFAEERVTDILIREKLLVLAESGDLDYFVAPDESKVKHKWDQGTLEQRYLGVDRSALKEGDSDRWRVNYDVLDGMPVSEYPKEAKEYPLDDSRNGWQIYHAQEKRAGPRHVLEGSGRAIAHAFTTEHFQCCADFALYLQSCWGFCINGQKVADITADLAAKFDNKNFPNLAKAGALREAIPPSPHKRQLVRALELTGGDEDFEKWRPALEAEGIKFKAGKPSSIDTKQLKALVTEVCINNKIEIPKTSDEEDANVSFDADAQEQLKGLNPALDEYITRQEIRKLVTAELPRLSNVSVIHPKYDVLKETGRTSSFGDKKGKVAAYPAINIQQVDPRIRPCFVAREGQILCSVDFDYLELVSLAQKCISLFGQSVLGSRINAGYDPHAYLGSSLCLNFDSEFKQAIQQTNIKGPEETYKAFKMLQELDEERYSKFRDFAKPTGLGFPGGLGPETFIEFARSQYGIDLVKLVGNKADAIELAAKLRAIWFETYPEMHAYFRWVNGSKDLDWSSPEEDRFLYQSPFGMIRRNCSYTACANGAALQTPSAEGAKLACWDLARACYDPSLNSCLFGCRPVAFIHDQIICEMPLDQWTHERAYAMAEIMKQSMSQVIRDVSVGAKPVLMLEWHKKAKTVIDPSGRLAIWHPKPQAA